MKALAPVVVLTALLCQTVLADQWQTTQPAGAAIGAPPTSTAPQFKPAPPSPLRAGAQAIRAAGYNDEFDGRASVKRAQFSNDDFTAGPKRDDVGQRRYTPPPRTAQREAQGSSSAGLGLSVDVDNEFAPSRSSQPPRPATTGDSSSFSTGNRTYVPPVDMGPSRPTPKLPATTTRNRTNPPPAAVPQRSTPPAVVPRDVLGGARDTTSGNRFNGANNGGAKTTAYPDVPGLTIGRPPATAKSPATTPPPVGRYDDGYRQAQVGPPPPVKGGQEGIAAPPNYGPSNPWENAANTAANTVERGARGVSNVIKSGADRISEEGRRRGDSYFLTLLALFASVGLNLYLGWIAWDTYNRYQDLVADMRYTGPRRSSTSDTDSSYSATAGIAS